MASEEGAEDKGRGGPGHQALRRSEGSVGGMPLNKTSSQVGGKDGCGQWDEKVQGLRSKGCNFVDGSRHEVGGMVSSVRVGRAGAKCGNVMSMVKVCNLHKTGQGRGKVDEC